MCSQKKKKKRERCIRRHRGRSKQLSLKMYPLSGGPRFQPLSDHGKASLGILVQTTRGLSSLENCVPRGRNQEVMSSPLKMCLPASSREFCGGVEAKEMSPEGLPAFLILFVLLLAIPTEVSSLISCEQKPFGVFADGSGLKVPRGCLHKRWRLAAPRGTFLPGSLSDL